MDQKMVGVKETKWKDLFLCISSGMASLGQADVLVSLPHHHFTGAMKYISPATSMNREATAVLLLAPQSEGLSTPASGR